MLMKILKGQFRHMSSAAGGGLIGYMLAHGYSEENILAILEHIETLAGLLLVFAAAGGSALAKEKKKEDV